MKISENLKKKIDQFGFAKIDNFIDDSQLKLMKNFVDEKVKENNNQYFFLTSESSEDNLLNNNKFFQKIEILLKDLVEEFGYKNQKDDKLYKVLRVVTGDKSEKVSLKYHFDAHLLTLLIPIYIPNNLNSNNGNLLIIKNLRKITKNIFINIIQKIFFQSDLFRKIFIDNNYVKKEILELEPGNVYIFNGFRSLHANMNINPKELRATILVHYYDLFNKSILVKINRSQRIKKELKNIDLNKKI